MKNLKNLNYFWLLIVRPNFIITGYFSATSHNLFCCFEIESDISRHVNLRENYNYQTLEV